ncbi:GTPase, G3E family [Lachnospiraceae bacterium RM5]|nr:GTPase, G3E family [Lachnospiraceae bacterium RM5]
MTKIDIISGFLGAGKTTLIKKLLEDGLNQEKLVLIENEFGEIGIDGGFLKDAGVEITEMNSGCICCTLVGDFGKALDEVITTYNPDRIIIEPSGVGKLSDVIKAVNDITKKDADVVLNSATTVVDGLKTAMYIKNFGEFFNNQVESAGTIVISRTQKMPEGKMDQCVGLLKEHNPNATIITTPWDEISGKVIVNAMEKSGSLSDELLNEIYEKEHEHEHEHEHHHEHEEHEHHHDHEEHEHHHEHEEHEHHHDHEEHEHHHDHEEHEHHHDHEEHDHHHEHGENCTCGCHDHDHDHHHHHADEVFTSWGRETYKKFEKTDVAALLEKFANTTEYGSILRAKGMIPTTENDWLYFDLVPGEYELRNGEPDYTGRLCVIGTNIDEDKLEEAFGLK